MKKFLPKKNKLGNQNRFLCSVSSGQDSINSFFVLFHLVSYPKRELNSIINSKTRRLSESLSKNRLAPVLFPQFFCGKQYFFSKTKFVSKLQVDSTNFVGTKFAPNPHTFFFPKERSQDSQEQNHQCFYLQVVYCHHFWQTKNFLSSLVLFRLSFLFQVPYSMILSETPLVTENRSRSWRRKNFCRLAYLEKMSTVTTGHTETDMLEKNLNNIIRGTSSRGLQEYKLLNYKKTITLFFSSIILKPLKTRPGKKSFYLVRFLTWKINSIELGQQRIILALSQNIFCRENTPISTSTFNLCLIHRPKLYVGDLYLTKGREKFAGEFQILPTSNLSDLGYTFPVRQIFNWRRSQIQNLGTQKKFFRGQKNLGQKTALIPKTKFSGKGAGSTVFFETPKGSTSRNLAKTKQKKTQFHFFSKTSQINFLSNFSNLQNIESQNLKKKKQLVVLRKKNLFKQDCIFFATESLSFCFYSKHFGKRINFSQLLQKRHRLTITKMVKFYELPLVNDLTNFYSKFSRNKIRHQLLPFIKSVFHKKFESRLSTFFQILQNEHQETEKQIIELCFFFQFNELNFLILENCVNFSDSKKIIWVKGLSRLVLDKMQLNIQLYTLQNFVFDYRAIDLNFSQIVNLKKFIPNRRKKI
jgi:tRNA(Ile)-lysidine synthase TilS/MesJ